MRLISVGALTLVAAIAVHSQAASQAVPPNASFYPTDPMNGLYSEVAKISASVDSLTKQMKIFVDKFEKVGGASFNEKQQKLVLGMELLMRAEARVAQMQKAQIELTERLNDSRARLTQVEIDLKPSRIERSVALEGSTQAEEMKDARRSRLAAERTSLAQMIQQLQATLIENGRALDAAQILAERLRRLYLPQVEREMGDQ